jgi:hypothetical protein
VRRGGTSATTSARPAASTTTSTLPKIDPGTCRRRQNALIEARPETAAALLDLLEQLGLDRTIVGALLGGGFDSQLATVGHGGGDTMAAVSLSETTEYGSCGN